MAFKTFLTNFLANVLKIALTCTCMCGYDKNISYKNPHSPHRSRNAFSEECIKKIYKWS